MLPGIRGTFAVYVAYGPWDARSAVQGLFLAGWRIGEIWFRIRFFNANALDEPFVQIKVL